jgi:hypothetical protein
MICATISSCGKDKDKVDYAGEIAGTYKGELYLMSVPMAEDVAITITRDGDNHVTLKLNQSVTGFGVINITCESGVTYADSKYAISGNTSFDMATDEVTGVTVPVPVKVTGTIDKSGNMDIQIDVDIPSASVSVNFKGKKQLVGDLNGDGKPD